MQKYDNFETVYRNSFFYAHIKLGYKHLNCDPGSVKYRRFVYKIFIKNISAMFNVNCNKDLFNQNEFKTAEIDRQSLKQLCKDCYIAAEKQY